NAPTSGRLFFLDLSAGRILSANPDGSDLKTIINEGRKLPDGLALDVDRNRRNGVSALQWTLKAASPIGRRRVVTTRVWVEFFGRVHYRLRRLSLQRQSRWVGPQDAAVCGRKPHWHCIRGSAVLILSDNTVKGCHFAAWEQPEFFTKELRSSQK
ncbi:MAG: hypothetical protein WB869_13355, partial [Candidatus Acidiferrales bacterium]